MHGTSFFIGVKNVKTVSKYSGSKLTVQLMGELDHHCAQSATEEICEDIDSTLPGEVCIDMRHLSFMDSSGIALIIRVNRRITENGGRLFIENPRKQPYRVMEAAGLLRLIEVRSGGEVTT